MNSQTPPVRSTTRPNRTLTLSGLLMGVSYLAAVLLSADGNVEPCPSRSDRSATPTPTPTATPTATVAERRRLCGARTLSGPYSAPIGTRLVYHSNFETTVRHRIGGQAAELRTGGSATVVVDVLERSEERILIALSRENVRLESTPENWRTAGQRKALLGRDLVELGTDGKILGYRFRPGLTPSQRTFQRSLTGAFAFTVPATQTDEWEAVEGDGTGTYVARYRRLSAGGEPIVIRRKKVRYTKVASAGSVAPTMSVDGAAAATFDCEVGWLREAEVDESAAMVLPLGGCTARSQFRGALSLVDVTHTPRGMDFSVLRDQEPFPAGATDGDMRDLREDRVAELRFRLRGKSFEAVLANLVGLVAAGVTRGRELTDAWSDLARFVEIDPTLAAKVKERILQHRLGSTSEELLLTALGAAGTKECQRILLDLHGDAGLADRVRATAAIAMTQLERPQPEMVDELGRQLESATQLGEIESAGMLALGTLASRTEPAVGSSAAVEVLAGLEERAISQGTTDVWLMAMANSDSKQAADRIAAHLGKGDERTRVAAAIALRGIRSTDVVPVLAGRARDDSSPFVRAEAVRSLAQKDGASASAAVRERALKDPDETVRLTAVLTMGPESATTLQLIAAKDRSERVREAARKRLEK